MSEVYWIEAHPRDAGGSAAVEVLLAGGGQKRSYYRAGKHYYDGVISRPLFSAALGFDETGWSGQTTPATSSFSFSSWSKDVLDELAEYYWPGASITIDAGAEEDASPPRLLAGTVIDMLIQNDTCQFTVADMSDILNRPVSDAIFDGSGGIEGISEVAGRFKRRSWGYVFNVEGRLIDPANSIYEFGDPDHPFTSWTTLRDKGREASPAPVTLPWAGTKAATFAALQGAIAPQGSGVVAPSIAMAKWWTDPAGPLTADFIGSPGSGGSMQIAAIIDAVSAHMNGPLVTGLPAANVLRPGIAGLHIASARESAAAAIDRLVLGASIIWQARPSGEIFITEWAFDESAEIIKAEYLARVRSTPPHHRRVLGFRKNQRRHSDAEVAESLVYGDGKTLDEVRSEIVDDIALAASSADWSSVIGRPVELTDGRVSSGIDQSGFNIQGLAIPGGGHLSTLELIKAGIAGKSLAYDPEFFRGVVPPNLGIYNNIANGSVSYALVSDDSAPNGTGMILRVSYDGSALPSPGFGGLVLSLLKSSLSRPGYYAPGTKVAFHIKAKIPVGRQLNQQSNATGTGATVEWLTPQAGTGQYEDYIFIRTIGTTGTFGSTGHFYVHNGANVAFSWDVASYDQLEISAPIYPTLSRLVNSSGVLQSDTTLITGQGDASGVIGAGAGLFANSLFDLDPVQNTKLGGIQSGATVGAAWGTNVANLPLAIQPANMTSGSIRSIYTRWADGSTIESLKPAQAGADSTALNNASGVIGGSSWVFENTLSPVTVSDRTQRLSSAGRLNDGRALKSNKNFGKRYVPVGVSLTDIPTGGTVSINIAASTFNTDWGTALAFPAATLTGLAYSTRYYIWRNQTDPTSASGSYGSSTNELDALGPDKAYLGYFTTRASSSAPPPPPPPPPPPTGGPLP